MREHFEQELGQIRQEILEVAQIRMSTQRRELRVEGESMTHPFPSRTADELSN